ncbi:MAG: TonB-dependent receptor [Erythrobacter sp.]|jgi:vitamin B12 transporter|nr:TonB-dependent receptor [Erythrobacter sp.]
MIKPAAYLFAATGAALAVSPALAQSPSQSLDLPDDAAISSTAIVVTANRTQRELSRVGESVSVVAEEEIVNRQPNDVLDILRTLPGVTFNRNGGAGTVAGFSIRGAESDQTVVLIDGVKLNDPAAPGGGTNLGTLVAGNIARIEVVRGAQSVLYGSQAIGGVVNLITREPSETPEFFGRAEYGERGTAQLVGNVSARVGPISASLGATFLTSDGISAFSEVRGGTEKDGFESLGINAKLDIALAANVALDLRGFYADAHNEFDGFPPPAFALADTPAVGDTTNLVGYAGVNAAFLDGRFRNRLAFAYTRIDRTDFDSRGGAEIFDAEGENRRFEYQGVLDTGDFADIVFGAEREESEFRTLGFGALEAADVWINSVYAQANLAPLEGLSLTGGLRHDDHKTFGGKTTFQASGTYSPGGGATVLRASYGEGFKAPSLFQLFSNIGNPDLEPEKAQTWDAGITHSFLEGRALLGVTYFERDAENLIIFVGCFENPLPPCQGPNPPFGTYDNVARASASGWEFQLALQPVDRLDIAAQYSTIDAINNITENRLPRRPQDTFSLNADYRLPGGIGLGATVLMVGDSFDNAANSVRLDSYVITDIRASYGITEELEIFGRVENLFDAQYETVFLYGQPGRAAFGGVRYRM